jgi:hypothetical protein
MHTARACSSPASRTGARGPWNCALAALFLLGASAACASSAGDGGSDGGLGGSSAAGGSSTPQGASECAERHFSKLSHECSTLDCGEALLCTSDWECLTCSDRCTSVACGSDQDCESAYGHLCDDVEWRCEPYITADNLRCAVHDVGESRCGDDVCSGAEGCEDCAQDCGYCPGTAPAMAACTSNAECASGVCSGWCVAACSSGWDCVGDGNGVLYGDCVISGDGNAYCFPNCTVEGGCANYPGTACLGGTSVDGWGVEVCALP